MATLSDIAKKAGVSTATASRAFQENASISQEMRERVYQAAKELDYMPNLLARGLRKNQSNLIGLDICDIQNPFYTLIIKAMEGELKKSGYQLVLSYSNGDDKEERKNLELFLGMQVMGVAFMPNSSKNKKLVSLMAKQGIAVLQLFNRVYDFLDTISIMDDRGTQRATKYLIANGHEKILMLNVTTPYSADRAYGYRLAMEEAGIPVDERYIIAMEQASNPCEKIQELIKELRPTAIIAGVYAIGKSTVRACQKMHLQIPKDISVITIDDVEWPELLEMTAVAQPIEYVGISAVRILMDRIKGTIDSQQPVIMSVDSEMQIRKSVSRIVDQRLSGDKITEVKQKATSCSAL